MEIDVSSLRTSVLLCLAFCACRSGRPVSMQDASTFYQRFSLRETVNGLNLQQLESSPAVRSGTITEGQGVVLYRGESTLTIDVLNRDGLAFDELGFATALRTAIVHEITGNGAVVSDGGTDGMNFWCEYQTRGIRGTLEISATPAGQGAYRLKSVISETLSR